MARQQQIAQSGSPDVPHNTDLLDRPEAEQRHGVHALLRGHAARHLCCKGDREKSTRRDGTEK